MLNERSDLPVEELHRLKTSRSAGETPILVPPPLLRVLLYPDRWDAESAAARDAGRICRTD